MPCHGRTTWWSTSVGLSHPQISYESDMWETSLLTFIVIEICQRRSLLQGGVDVYVATIHTHRAFELSIRACLFANIFQITTNHLLRQKRTTVDPTHIRSRLRRITSAIMLSSTIMRTIGQRTLLPTTKNFLVDTLPSSRNLRLDSRPYHATPRRLCQPRKSKPATNSQGIGNSVDRSTNFRWFYPSAILVGSVAAWAQILGAVPGTEEALRRQRIWSNLMSIRKYSKLILDREARKAKGENKAEDSKEAEDAEKAEDANQSLGWQGFRDERRILMMMIAAFRDT